jgi:hypothetical protein
VLTSTLYKGISGRVLRDILLISVMTSRGYRHTPRKVTDLVFQGNAPTTSHLLRNCRAAQFKSHEHAARSRLR